MKLLRRYAGLFIGAGAIIALDQWTKHLVRTHIPLGTTWLPAGWENLETYARVVHWYNTGAAFGIFQGGSLVFTMLAFIVSIAILWFYAQPEASEWYLSIPLTMQFGGAVGNLIDRLLFEGRVTDMISIGNFAVFNLADASISVGTAIMLLGIWVMEKKEKAGQKTEERKQAQNAFGSDEIAPDPNVVGEDPV